MVFKMKNPIRESIFYFILFSRCR